MIKKTISFLLIATTVFSTSSYIFIQKAPQASADIATGLVSHWKLDETTGTTATDSVGTNNGTLTNGPTWITGKLNNALNFDGTDDYVSIPRMNYDEVSVSAWFNRDTVDTATPDVIFGGWSWDTVQGYGLYFNQYSGSRDTIRFILTTKTSGGVKTQKVATKDLVTSTGTWYHVTGTYNKTTGEQKLYVDGQLANTQTHTAGNTIVPYTYASYMAIGSLTFNYGHMDGKIDDVRVYNRALIATDITELYNIAQPTVTTNAATNIAQTTATLNATVNPNNLSTSAYFEYGTSSGTYTTQTSTQNLTGSTDQSITANITNLTAGTVYYYRAVATNELGTTNGTEQSFIMLSIADIIAPTGGYVSSGYIFSKEIAPLNLKNWNEFSWNDNKPLDTETRYRIFYATSTDWYIIPDSDLPGNLIGFTASPVSISSLSIDDYPKLKLKGDLSTADNGATPILYDWHVSWRTIDPAPVGNVQFHLRGNKIIGRDIDDAPVYKYSQNHTSNGSGHLDLPGMEWDAYNFTVDGSATGFELVGTDPSPQPINLFPATNQPTDLFLLAQNSLIVEVKDIETGDPIFSANVRIYNTGFGYDKTQYTDSDGETIFIPIEDNGTYNYEVGVDGYDNASGSVSVSGGSSKIIYLIPGQI